MTHRLAALPRAREAHLHQGAGLPSALRSTAMLRRAGKHEFRAHLTSTALGGVAQSQLRVQTRVGE